MWVSKGPYSKRYLHCDLAQNVLGHLIVNRYNVEYTVHAVPARTGTV